MKNKENKMKAWNPRNVIMLGALAAILVIGGVSSALAGADSPAKDYVASALADYVKEHGDSSVAGGLLTWLNGSDETAFGATSLSEKNVAGNFNRVAECDSDKPSDACIEHGREFFYIGSSSSTVISWRNQLGRDIWIERVHGEIFGTATTSVQFTMGTSTVSGVPYTSNGYNFSTSTAPNSSILDRYVIATSTNPYIDTAYGREFSYRTDVYGVAPSSTYGSNTLVPVRNGEYVLGFLRAFNPMWAVTSTANRGFSANSYVIVDYMVVNTSTSR